MSVHILLRDLRYSLRLLAREPGFTVLAILTLALGIGAATAIFTVVDSVLLRPLAYKDADRLVVALHGPEASSPVSPADYADYRREAHSFEGLAAAQAWGVTLGGGDRPERVAALQVSANLIDLLGVAPLLGRSFAAGEDEAGRARVVLLGHGLWQRRFGASPSIVGTNILLDGQPYTVLGVMPPTFRFAPFWQTRAELWAPLALTARRDDRDGRSLRVFGRLRPGISVQQAQQEMTAIASRLEREHPATNTGVAITVRPLLDKVVADVRGTLLALMGMVTCVLLIACANVASAMLARASGRQQEVAVRLALGASPWRVVRQLLTESLLLTSAGSVVGFVAAAWGVSWLMSLLPPGSLPRQQDVGFDLRIYLAATLATVIAGVVTGLIPALQIARPQLSAVFQGARGATEAPARTRTRRMLVAAEVALAFVLLVGAGLMGRTLLALATVDPGFNPERLVVAGVSLAGTPYAAPGARYPMYQRLRERFAALPGVVSVSAVNHLPIAGDVWTLGYTVEGRPAPAQGDRWAAIYRVVDPQYFSTIGLPVVEGRDFTDADRAGAIPVVVINKSMADRRWPGESPIGRRIRLPGPGNLQAPVTIIGVVGNARQRDWTAPPDDEVFVALAQRSMEFGLSGVTFVLRTSARPEAIAAAIPAAAARVDRAVPVSAVTTMEAVVAEAIWRQRLTAQLTAMFAIVALVLAAIGIYAAVAYSVAKRTREFGVRIALGGTPRQVQRLAVIDGLKPIVPGAALGAVGALLAARATERLLYGVPPLDVVSFGGSLAALIAVAVAAAWLPARRASRQDPMAALRQS
ncbi:MAG: ABC transporter permease [Vicinamibacterales bacterium]